ncbi:hypothetical protein AA313_de0203061 [Arthrobotrys entomopaga]|nr:hypothetical protein AA313_de0203061 [Arthrobotrys entomopaga]
MRLPRRKRLLYLYPFSLLPDPNDQNFAGSSLNRTENEDNRNRRRADKPVRPYDTVASDGEITLNLPIPAVDLSPEGSELILHESNGYYMWRLRDPDVIDPNNPEYYFLIPLLRLGMPTPTSFENVRVYNYPPNLRTGDAMASAPFRFTCSTTNGLLVVRYAYKDEDVAEHKENRFSEIVYRVWHDQARIDGVSVDSIRYIAHNFVANDETVVVVKNILSKVPSARKVLHVGEPPEEIRLSASSDDEAELTAFRAMVGCPNGKGVARMLNEHSHALGRKQITRVIIYVPDPNGFDPEDGGPISFVVKMLL